MHSQLIDCAQSVSISSLTYSNSDKVNIVNNVFRKGLTMASLNINSLLAHIDDLRVIIDNSNIDILAINETKLDFSVDDDQVYLPGFDIIRKDRLHNGRSGGGVCIYLRSSLNFRIREDLLNDNLECIVVEISNTRSKPFLVGTWYRPPNSPSDLFSYFETLLDKIDSENSEFHLLGEINCNMMSLLPERNTCSSELMNILDIFDFHQLITEPTRITLDSQTLIDLCITNSTDKITASGTLSLGISDHSLVYLVRKSSYPKGGRVISQLLEKILNISMKLTFCVI